MKTISVKQPWATLLCSGIKDIENRTWKTEHRGKILIHASSTRVSKKIMDFLPLEMMQIIDDHIQLGNLDNLDTYPTSAIIGYVDIKDCVRDHQSIWAEPAENWIIENAYLFDKPILNVKGKLNIFDYEDIDENNLPPAHKVELKIPSVKGDILIIPVTKDTIETINNLSPQERGINLSFIPELHESWLIKDKEGLYYPPVVSKIKLVAGTESQIYEADEIFFGDRIEEDGNPKTYFSLFEGEETPWHCVQINFH